MPVTLVCSYSVYQDLFPSHKEPVDKAIVCTGLPTHSVQVTITVSGVVHTWQTLGQEYVGMTLLSTVIGEQHIDQSNTTCTAGCRYVGSTEPKKTVP